MHSIKASALVKIILLILFLGLAFIFFIRKNLSTDVRDLLTGGEITLGNIERELFPKRRRPFSVVRQETELKLLLSDPFISFSRDDWDEFWDLIYGNRGYDIPENPRLPYTHRQLTLREIEEALKGKYPIFTQFGNMHWEEFWKVALRQKRFRR